MPTKEEVPDDALMSHGSDGALQIAIADTSTEGEENFLTLDQRSVESSSSVSKRRGGRGGRGRGRGRTRKENAVTPSNQVAK